MAGQVTPRYSVEHDGLNPLGTVQTQPTLFNLGLEQTPQSQQGTDTGGSAGDRIFRIQEPLWY